MKWGMREKLLAGYVLVFLLIGGLGGGYAFIRAADAVRDEVDQHLKSTTESIQLLVRQTADQAVQSYLRSVAEKNRDIVQHYYNLYRTGRMSEEAAKHEASQVLLSQTIGLSGYVYVLSPEGKLLVHPEATTLGKDISEFPFVREQIRRKEGFLHYQWRNPSEMRPRLKALYMTWFEPWGWIISASTYRSEFASLVSMTALRSAVLSYRMGASGYPFILSGEGKVLVHPLREGGDVSAVSDGTGRSFVREMLERRDGRITYLWRNEGEDQLREKVVLFSYLPDYDWIVAMSVYTEEVYAPLKTMQMHALLGLGGSLVLLVLVGGAVVVGVTGPLRRLTAVIRAGAQGDLTARVIPEARDEVGELAGYYNLLIGRLENNTLRLEEVVESRTAELRKANAAYVAELEARTHTEAEARNRLDFLRALMDAIPSPVFYRDRNCNLLDCNDMYLRMVLGRERNEAVGQSLSAFSDVYSTEHRRLACTHDEALWQAGGGVRVLEMSMRCADGREHLFSVQKTLFHGPDGMPLGIIGVMSDITDMRAAEHARTLVRVVGEMATDGILVVDGGGTIVYANPVFANFVGMSRDDVTGRHMDALAPEAAPWSLGLALARIMAGAETWSGSVALATGAGGIMEAECTATAIGDGAGHQAYICLQFAMAGRVDSTT